MANINARFLLANFLGKQICVSETWLLPHIPYSYVHISGYRVFRCNNGQGGGACVYVKDSLLS